MIFVFARPCTNDPSKLSRAPKEGLQQQNASVTCVWTCARGSRRAFAMALALAESASAR